jgi:hypothetical protein
MTEDLNARLDAAFHDTAKYRDQRQAWRKQARTDPLGTAMQVLEAIVVEMASEHAESGELYGIDVSDLDSARDYDPRTFVEQLDIVQRVNHYRILRRAQEELDSYAADVSLSEQERAARMCEVGLEAWKALDALFLHTLRQISVHADPGRVRTLAEDTETCNTQQFSSLV